MCNIKPLSHAHIHTQNVCTANKSIQLSLLFKFYCVLNVYTSLALSLNSVPIDASCHAQMLFTSVFCVLWWKNRNSLTERFVRPFEQQQKNNIINKQDSLLYIFRSMFPSLPNKWYKLVFQKNFLVFVQLMTPFNRVSIVELKLTTAMTLENRFCSSHFIIHFDFELELVTDRIYWSFGLAWQYVYLFILSVSMPTIHLHFSHSSIQTNRMHVGRCVTARIDKLK